MCRSSIVIGCGYLYSCLLNEWNLWLPRKEMAEKCISIAENIFLFSFLSRIKIHQYFHVAFSVQHGEWENSIKSILELETIAMGNLYVEFMCYVRKMKFTLVQHEWQILYNNRMHCDRDVQCVHWMWMGNMAYYVTHCTQYKIQEISKFEINADWLLQFRPHRIGWCSVLRFYSLSEWPTPTNRIQPYFVHCWIILCGALERSRFDGLNQKKTNQIDYNNKIANRI